MYARLYSIINRISEHELVKHETKRNAFYRFIIVSTLFTIYLIAMVLKYGVEKGVLVSLLTWSFFVFCTPIADAGFLLDFPIRLLTGIRMLYSEIMVWIFAFLLNLYANLFTKDIYSSTKLLQIFYKIQHTIFPYWLIIILSAIGTFLSVYFGDELLDVAFHHEREKWKKHRIKYHAVILLFIFVAIFSMYVYLLERLGLGGILG